MACRERNATTLYLRADGPNDTLHYLWDFVGKPSVLLAVTSPSVYLNISWRDYLAGREHSVVFSEPPAYTFGIIIDKVPTIVNTYDGIYCLSLY